MGESIASKCILIGDTFDEYLTLPLEFRAHNVRIISTIPTFEGWNLAGYTNLIWSALTKLRNMSNDPGVIILGGLTSLFLQFGTSKLITHPGHLTVRIFEFIETVTSMLEIEANMKVIVLGLQGVINSEMVKRAHEINSILFATLSLEDNPTFRKYRHRIFMFDPAKCTMEVQQLHTIKMRAEGANETAATKKSFYKTYSVVERSDEGSDLPRYVIIGKI